MSNQIVVSAPNANGDGIACEETHYSVSNVLVDFSSLPLDKIDECCSVTRGGSADFINCTFKGAEKICLIGSGDEDQREREAGKKVYFRNCVFTEGSRRMPEVQSGMECYLLNCTISNWCIRQPTDPAKARGFGAWAHDGGKIYAVACRFEQDSFWKGLKAMVSDLLGHLGNAVNESGIAALFKPKSWLPGVCRGLTATDGGYVEAIGCTKNHWWIRIENNAEADEEAMEAFCLSPEQWHSLPDGCCRID